MGPEVLEVGSIKQTAGVIQHLLPGFSALIFSFIGELTLHIIKHTDHLPLEVDSHSLLWLPFLLISILRSFQLQFCAMTRGQTTAGMSSKFRAHAKPACRWEK